MKRIISTLMSIALLSSCIPVFGEGEALIMPSPKEISEIRRQRNFEEVALAGENTAEHESVSLMAAAEDFAWNISADGTLTISGDCDMPDYDTNETIYNIPWYEQRDSIKRIVIEDGITSISEYAFCNCEYLTSVTMPDSMITICETAFYNCCSLASINIPKSVTTIGEGAFSFCNNLQTITVAADNPNYKAIDGNLYSKDETVLVKYALGKTDNSFTIPSCVTTIGNRAFYSSYNLDSITVPGSVTTIGDCAFSGCFNIKSITVAADNPNYKDINGNLYSKDETILLQYAIGKLDTSFTISDSVKIIGNEAFWRCYILTDITIPEGVTDIGYGAFSFCGRLNCIAIPKSVTTVGVDAFSACHALTTVKYGGSKQQWNKTDGLYNNSYLYMVNIIYGEISDIKEFAWNISEDGTLTISGDCDMPDFNADYSLTYLPWYGQRDSIKRIVIEDGITSISEYAFSGCQGLKSVTIPDGVTTISNYAFYCSYSLSSITIPDSVTTIRDNAFCGSGLESITIPGKVTSIGEGAFSGCYNLKNVTIGESVTTIGDYAFCGCSYIESITIPDSVTSVGEYAFCWCYGLTSINIPKSGPPSVKVRFPNATT